ncbi:MAG: PQQ-dependent sugar dehydrogenase, partial [Pseudomonadota bacterium]
MRGILLLALVWLSQPAASEVDQGEPNADFLPAFENQTRAPELSDGPSLRVALVAKGLEHPWGMAVLPDGAGYLVTERPGRLNRIASDGTVMVVTGTP